MKFIISTLAVSLLLSPAAFAAKKADKEQCRSTPYQIQAPEGYNHGLFAPSPQKRLVQGGGYISSLDDEDDDDPAIDGPDYLMVPEWVAYEMRAYKGGDYAPGWERPNTWYRQEAFDLERDAKDISKRVDDSYRGVGRLFNRGHLASRSDLNRLGERYGCNSHSPDNAVPQLAKFNQGIWLGLENYIASLANVKGRVWVNAGPIFERKIRYIGDPDEFKVAIPSHLWKTVFWVEDKNIKWRAWIYPNVNPSFDAANYKTGNCAKDRVYDHKDYLVSLGEIEARTGLTMVSAFPDEIRETMLDYRHETMPEIAKSDFIGQCH